MAYDEELADRARSLLSELTQPGGTDSLTEKKMFGGLCLMINGNMCCGVAGNELMARVGVDGHADALAQPYAKPMDFTGWPMKGFVFVHPEGVKEDEGLKQWIERCVGFAKSLPKK